MLRFQHDFSFGKRKIICIARALALNPKLIIGNEPVSALDVSIQAQVINLLMDLQREKNLSYLFIAHDLAVVKHISHRIAVMYLGKIVEYTDKQTLFTNPLHPYTEALLAAVPVPNPRIKRKKQLLQGDVPSPINPPPGCTFHTRCPYAEAQCKVDVPALREVSPGHRVTREMFGEMSLVPAADELRAHGGAAPAPVARGRATPVGSLSHLFEESPPSHCDAAKERLRPTVVSDAPEPVRREHRVKPVFPIGIIFYLASIGIVAIATVGVLFGIGFSLLVHPADALGAGAAARSHGSGVRPLFYGLVPNFFGDTVAA